LHIDCTIWRADSSAKCATIRGISNPLSDTFDIVAICDCGHRADVDLSALPQTMTVDQLRTRLRCSQCRLDVLRVECAMVRWRSKGIGYRGR
jgi:hypothetical protein